MLRSGVLEGWLGAWSGSGRAQERRKLFLGRAVLPNVLKSPESIETMRRIAAKGGDAAEIELWSDEDLRADYTPAPVGLEGASKSGR